MRRVVNNELEGMWQEAVVVWMQVWDGRRVEFNTEPLGKYLTSFRNITVLLSSGMAVQEEWFSLDCLISKTKTVGPLEMSVIFTSQRSVTSSRLETSSAIQWDRKSPTFRNTVTEWEGSGWTTNKTKTFWIWTHIRLEWLEPNLH